MRVDSSLFRLTTVRRQSLFYALIFIGSGASLPYMPLWFASKGMSGAQIGLILALPLLLRAVTGPIMGVWAEKFPLFRSPMIRLAIAGGVAYGGLMLWPVAGDARFWLFVALWAVGYSCITSISPLLDVMTIQMSKREAFNYTGPRAVGSASFIAANIAVGYGLNWIGVDLVVIWVVVLCFLAAGAAWAVLPRAPRHIEEGPTATDSAPAYLPQQTGAQRIRELLANPVFVLLLAAMGCVQGAHAFYYGFSTIIWKSQGLDGATSGYLWGAGVAAEVLFLMFGFRLRNRFGSWTLLVAAAGLSTLRWFMMGFAPPAWALWPLQTLHAFSFAACYLAGLDLVNRMAPKGSESLAQTLNAAWVTGVMMGLSTLASGPVYDALGGRGYWVMAGMAGAGLLIAAYLYRRQVMRP
ncbi:MFS transporter [Asticcacaulis sp. AND118]|uniref:MFS transporter n=1 Tax=Asticcacaulis sp. AND118 TaxID=2840468 RepID=UPI001D000DFF|nr:MFS transporter [Asticcacaulis sp. AND118]UDF02958.1 MFS transporter [Asticcacaulis sp. AND118]